MDLVLWLTVTDGTGVSWDSANDMSISCVSSVSDPSLLLL